MRSFQKIMLVSLLPYYQKKIQPDQKYHWEMALVELFWPKQGSVAVIENLWYEKQETNRRWKRTYVPSSAFFRVTSIFDYLRNIFKDIIDINYDEYKTNGHLENERHKLQSIQSSTLESISQKYGVQYVIGILTFGCSCR